MTDIFEFTHHVLLTSCPSVNSFSHNRHVISPRDFAFFLFDINDLV